MRSRTRSPTTRLSVNGERLVCRAGNSVFLTTLQGAFDSRRIGDAVSLDRLVYRVDTQAEWQQVFSDAWRWYDEFFYDADMHGHDWKAIGERYRAVHSVPLVARGTELADVADGGRTVRRPRVHHGRRHGARLDAGTPVFTGLLGVDLVADTVAGRYRFETDLRPDRIQPRPQGAARAAGYSRQGRRLPHRDRRPVGQGWATTTGNCSRSSPGRKSR